MISKEVSVMEDYFNKLEVTEIAEYHLQQIEKNKQELKLMKFCYWIIYVLLFVFMFAYFRLLIF